MTLARKILDLLKETQQPGTLPDKGMMPVPFQIADCHFDLTPEQKATTNYEDVDLTSLIATQKTVDAGRVREIMNDDSTVTGVPCVVRSEGKHYIADGHHRLTSDFFKGVTRQRVKVVQEDLDLSKTEIEKAAENVHDRWMENQKKKGHDSHKSPDGKEEYMVPYDELSEPAKKLDRDAVEAVVDALNEDGMAVGGGGIAGIGVNQQGQPSSDKFAEPGVPVRKKLQPEEDKFAGADVFKVDMDKVMSSRYGPKNRYHRFAKYIGNDEDAEDIRVHARSNRNDVVLQDKSTGVMQYLRRRLK